MIQSLACFVNRSKLDVSEPFGIAIVDVGRQANAKDGPMLSKLLSDDVLRGLKGDVCNKQCITWRAFLITIAFGTLFVSPSSAGSRISTRSRKVDVDGAIVNGESMELIFCFGSVGGVDEFNVSKSGMKLVSLLTQECPRMELLALLTLWNDHCSYP